MKLPFFFALTMVLGLSGCESSGDFPSAVSHIAQRGEPKVRDFKADKRGHPTTQRRRRSDGMGYRFVHGGPAEGRLEALSEVMSGDTPGSSRQVSLKVTFEPTLDGGTEVTALFSEVIEQDSSGQPGMATQTPMADTPLYEVAIRN